MNKFKWLGGCLRNLPGIVGVVGGLLFIFSGHLAATELKGTPEELRRFLHPAKQMVTLRTKVEETAFADRAIFNILITTEDDKLSVALSKNETLKKRVSEALIKAGVKPSDINTSKFSSSPQYGWFGDEPDSYEIVARLAVIVSQSEQFKAIASLVDKYKEVKLGSVSYKHTDKDQVKAKLREKAMAKINQTKAAYEASLGVKLKAVAFGDSEIGLQPTRGAAEKISLTGSRIKGAKTALASSSAVKPASSRPQSFEEVKYALKMWVNYQVIE